MALRERRARVPDRLNARSEGASPITASVVDILLGIVLGLTAGLAFRPLTLWGLRTGHQLFRARRREAALPEGRLAARTAARVLLGAVLGTIASGAIIFGTTLPMAPVVHVWPRFVLTWSGALVAGALAGELHRRRLG